MACLPRASVEPRCVRIWAYILAATTLLLVLCPSSMTQASTATSNMTVQIEITASCTIASAPTLDFGNNAATSLLTSQVSQSTTVSVTCSNGSPYSIGFDNGLNSSGSQRRVVYSGAYLNYNLYTDSAHTHLWTTGASNSTCSTANSCYLGTGTGAAQTISIYGVVPTVATAPAPGTYTDTTVMTITY
jgi:spore coat protein U-like protein